MRSLTLGTALLAFFSSPRAQSNTAEIYPDPNATTGSSRGTLGVNGGEVLQEVPLPGFAGIGDRNGQPMCSLLGGTWVMQDQNAGTQEPYSFLLRRANATMTGPDPTAAGVLTQTALTSPPGTGTAAWLVSTTFTTVVQVDCRGGLFVGLGLSPNPLWTLDGLSNHIATYAGGLAGDNPRANAKNLGWQISAGAATQPSPRVWNMGLLVDTPVLNPGGDDPLNNRQPPGTTNYGAGGLYPDVSGMTRSDGLRLRVRDAARSHGIAAFLMAGGPVLHAGIPFAFLGQGSLWLSPTGFVALGASPLDANGVVEQVIAPPGTIPTSVAGGALSFQALTLGSSVQLPGAFSNGTTVEY